MESSRKKTWLRNIFLLVISLLFVEGALRTAGFFYDGERPFVFGEKGETGKTVLCLGDSYTYGGNVAWRDAYPYRLWLELKKYFPVRVVNVGRCEYNSAQVLSGLKKNLDEYKPDYVVLLAGASDKWNLIDCDPENDFAVCLRDYEGRAPGAAENQNFLKSLRIYKLLRGFYLNRRLEKLLKITESGEPLELDAAGQKKVAKEVIPDLVYSSRYEKALETSLLVLAGLKKDSLYFSENLSYYFALGISYEFQSKYSSGQVAGRMREIMAGNPDFAANGVFLKYLAHFEKRAESEKEFARRLEKNLFSIAAETNRRGIRLVILNYPSDYAAANETLRKTAAVKKAVFIDVYSRFSELIKKDGRERYLMGDDHATPAGHEEMAALAAAELEKLWTR